MRVNTSWARLMAIIGVFLLIGVTGAQAAMTNGTETLFTVSSGELTFDWDMNSQYDLSPFKASVQIDGIYTPSAVLIGTIYEFLIPNFYDPLPKKTVDITMVGANSGASGLELAYVLDVFGVDSPFGMPGPAVPVMGNFVAGTTTPTLVTEQWEIFPNPDFEYIKIWAPTEYELQSITIKTQSVPLPPSILMLGSAIFGLGFLRRKLRLG